MDFHKVLRWLLLYLIFPVLLKMLLYWQPESFNRNGSRRFGAVKSDSTHPFFGNVCTNSVPLQFSQFYGCWLILSVCWLVSFAFPFGRLLGVRLFCYYPYWQLFFGLKYMINCIRYDCFQNDIFSNPRPI